MHFANNLRVLRKNKGRSQDEVVIAVGMKRSSYAGWEQGTAQPSLEKLVELASYHHMTLDALLLYDLDSWPKSTLDAMIRAYTPIPA